MRWLRFLPFPRRPRPGAILPMDREDERLLARRRNGVARKTHHAPPKDL